MTVRKTLLALAANRHNLMGDQAEGLVFEKAFTALKEGKSIARRGWNGKGMFLTVQRPDEHSKMTQSYIFITIPAKVSEQFGPEGISEQHIPWHFSQTDMFASDWVIV